MKYRQSSEPRLHHPAAGVGIGIIADNYSDALIQCLEAIRRHNHTPAHLVVAANDSVHIRSLTNEFRIPIIKGHDFGPAWNKNRTLAYLLGYTRCDPILLIEAICHPIEDGWEQGWIEAARLRGHVSYADLSKHQELLIGGLGSSQDPYRVSLADGRCTISTRSSLEKVGYLDTRLVNANYANTEWTSRFMRVLGYAGNTLPALNAGLACIDTPGQDYADEERDALLLPRLNDEPAYRPAFRNRVEQERLYRELTRARWPLTPEGGTSRLISVICPVHQLQTAQELAASIQTMSRSTDGPAIPYEMIWVWHGEGTCSLPGLVIEHLETPFVFAETVNRGVMASSGEVLLIIPAHTQPPSEGSLHNLLRLYAEQPDTEVCYRLRDGEWDLVEELDNLDWEQECWAVKRHAFCAHGGLDESRTATDDLPADSQAPASRSVVAAQASRPPAPLGIGITTYNRIEALTGCIKRIEKHTRTPYHLVIADDGSTDGTLEWARQRGLRVITGDNKGLAWNRNRALYYLNEYTRCDPIILLDDDCWPVEDNWQQPWLEAAERWGHVDHAFAPYVVIEGQGTSREPYRCIGSSGNCCCTSRDALSLVGYQDLRLSSGWGYDDMEWTLRFSRALSQQRGMPPDVHLGLSHGIRMMDCGTWCDDQKLERNREVFEQLLHEDTVCRPAWRNDEEQALLKGEITTAIQARLQQAQKILFAPRGLVAPVDTADCDPRWEGRLHPKPWEYAVTAIIPHLETPEPLRACIELLRLQSVRPYIIVVDTGSSPATMSEIESLRAADVEIHFIRSHGFRHSSEPVGAAQDLAFALCHSEYLFCTHADCFLRRRDYIEWLLSMCGEECPAVGYQMSPRDWLTDQWEGMVSHTATLLHMPTMWRLGVTWSFERAHNQFDVPRTAMGWPDTETCMNYVLQAAGVKPLLIGNETNYERHVDENVDHPRSFAGSKFYGAEYHLKAQGWMADALREAHERATTWKASGGASTHSYKRSSPKQRTSLPQVLASPGAASSHSSVNTSAPEAGA